MKKLGKLPARPGSVSLKFGAVFNAAKLPTPPVKFGHADYTKPWELFSNDTVSDCVFAGAAHEHFVWGNEGGSLPTFTDANVISDYSAVTGYLPGNPETDQGTDMQQAASYRRKTGIVDAAGVRHKIDAYAALKVGDVDQLAQAVYLLGAVGVGINLPATAEDQFDAGQPWTFVPGTKLVGGHYVPCIGRNSSGNFLCVTWGRLHAMTPAFYENYCDEALCYLSAESLKNNLTPEGFDATQLSQFLAALAA